MDSYLERRKRVLERITPGVMVIATSPVALRNNDVEHEFRPDSDIVYLTGFPEPETVMVLANDGTTKKFILFVRPKSHDDEIWHGTRIGVDAAKSEWGADEAYPIDELVKRLPGLLENQRRVFYRLGQERRMDQKVLSALDRVRARSKFGVGCPTEIVDPATIVHEMRRIKAKDELATMQKAMDITCEGHCRAMAFAAPGRYEYEVESVLRHVFTKHGCERHAYSPIVGVGNNATILHYRANRSVMKDGELLLIDAGCEYGYYASDVTRTFPVNGTFSKPQRDIYELVLASQLAAIEASVPGKSLPEIHQKAVDVLVDGLLRLKLLEGDSETIIKEEKYKKFYMHRTNHYLGMDVHDVGLYFVDQKARPVEPGVVITVEPGLYFSAADDTIPEAYRGIGIRIEDDVLITDGKPIVMTSAIPKTVEEVEKTCAS
jgi:Xaa-Pro aminopeptidase